MRKLLCATLALRTQDLKHYTSKLVVGFEVTSTSDTMSVIASFTTMADSATAVPLGLPVDWCLKIVAGFRQAMAPTETDCPDPSR
jgi:hypothetical protein